MKRKMCSIAVLLLVAFPIPLTRAQVTISMNLADELIPRELVLGLLNIFDESDPTLLVGNVPAEVEADIPLPRGAQVLGSLTSRDGVLVVTIVSGTPSTVRANYVASLGLAGLKDQESAVQRGGFQVPPCST
jgi:hypothetical protein